MTERSSAWFISYDLRPGKQVERRLVLETLQLARSAGVDVSHLPFIGMGGVRYIDFLLAHKLLNISRFTSLEHDADIVARCEFNKPFSDLAVFAGSTEEYINQVGFPEAAIVWLDYERGVSEDLKEDMVALAAAVKPGSFVFITATAELPRRWKAIRKLPPRLTAFQKEVNPFGRKMGEGDVSKNAFHRTAAVILLRALKFGFAGRAGGKFSPYLRMNYKDSIWMMTVGGYFGPTETCSALKPIVGRGLPFLGSPSTEKIFQIQQFNITDAERRLLDLSAIAPLARRSEKMALRTLGFEDALVSQYAELARFIPRYFEAVF